MSAISSDGVSLTATVIVRFRLQRDAVPVLHQAIGPNYEQVLVQPGIGSLTRQVIAEYTAEQAYSTARQEIQDKIRNLVEERLSQKMMEHAGEEGEESYRVSMSAIFILYDILVTGIEMPPSIAKPNNTTSRRNIDFGSSAKNASRNARRSRQKAYAIFNRPSARASRSPTFAGAALRRRFSFRSPRIRRSS